MTQEAATHSRALCMPLWWLCAIGARGVRIGLALSDVSAFSVAQATYVDNAQRASKSYRKGLLKQAERQVDGAAHAAAASQVVDAPSGYRPYALTASLHASRCAGG